MFHSNRTVVVLLQKHFSCWLCTSCNPISNITNCTYANISNLTLWHMSTIHSPFSIYLLKPNFSSVPIVFCRFFTWITLGDADLHFSLIWVTEANVVEWGTTSAMWLYHQCNQSTDVADGMTVMSLSASLQCKSSATRDHLCQITLNQNFWGENFSGHITAKSCKKKLYETRPAGIKFLKVTSFDMMTQRNLHLWPSGLKQCHFDHKKRAVMFLNTHEFSRRRARRLCNEFSKTFIWWTAMLLLMQWRPWSNILALFLTHLLLFPLLLGSML